MKKFFLLVLLSTFLCLTGCNSSKLSKINLDELNQKITNKETFIVYFASNNDNLLEKKLNEVLEENNLEGYKVDINKISEEEKNKLQVTIDYSDPSIVFVINGTDPSILSHIDNEDTSKKEIVLRLKDMNFIK